MHALLYVQKPIPWHDPSAEELAPLAAAAGEIFVIREFSSETPPVNWTLWPVTPSGKWLPKFGGRLSEEDFAIRDEE